MTECVILMNLRTYVGNHHVASLAHYLAKSITVYYTLDIAIEESFRNLESTMMQT